MPLRISKDFASWKVAFDSMTELRAKHGWTAHTVLRDAADPNVITVVNRVASLEQAKGYGGSPELGAAMARGGVEGHPEIAFLDDAEDRAYR